MTTPARRQYIEIKAQHQDAILLYQVGDFYETFDEDAQTAARELQIALTSRSYGPGERVPLAGVPTHALNTYAARLVARGYKVAICDQVSPPGRGLVQRAVTRILTPGTVADPAMLPATRDNYLVAVARGLERGRGHAQASAGLAYVEVNSGVFGCTQWEGESLPDALLAELERLAPAEILIAEGGILPWADASGEGYLAAPPLTPTLCPAAYFDVEGARIRLCRHFGVPTLAAFGCADTPLAVAAAGALLAYLQRMNPPLLKAITSLRSYDTRGYVELDGRTWRALEVVALATPGLARSALSAGGAPRPATLLKTLDATRTAMGARLLRRTLLQPLRDRAALEARLEAVAELHGHPALRERVGAVLDGMGDIERLTARVVHGTATPRELLALAAALARTPELARALRGVTSANLGELGAALEDGCPEVRRRIEAAIADQGQESGHLLRAGFSAELDEMLRSSAEAREWIAALEPRERERTGIRSLKVGYNKVFGYYVEISHANRTRVPEDYERRQTLTNGERYVTAELKRYEALVLHAQEQIEALEDRLYEELLGELAGYQERLRRTAQAVSQADMWLALAAVAVLRGYVRPELSDGTELAIRGGRHPIVEASLDGGAFIPNDANFAAGAEEAKDDPGMRILLLTGPNMAGKSTYLRQVALITLLAQIGSFVPAEFARIGLVDRIFTRVGAEDNLAAGLSTFMLEMVETAYILRHATPRSLIALDEVGRGTSTRDGLAIARAVLEYVHDAIGARTLFATHYHELAALADELPRLQVFQMEVTERDGQAIFLHRIVHGACDESYGVQVARMAGVPAAVTERAGNLLARTVAARNGVAERRRPYEPVRDGVDGMNAVDGNREQEPVAADIAGEVTPSERQIALALASINIGATTPIEALNFLFSLQQRALALLRERKA